MTLELDVNQWASEQFGLCELGDARRTARAVKVASQFAADPSASTPDQTETWSDCKATYRLLEEEDVTFTALATPHWKATQARPAGHYLLIDDTTIISYSNSRQIEGLGIVEGRTQGFLLHSALMVDADGPSIIGLAGQTIHYRQAVPKKEKASQRRKRARESKVWGDVIEIVGTPPAGCQFTHVCDRGADTFEVYCRLRQQGCGCVIRAAQLKRLIVTPQGEQVPLQQYLQTLPLAGTYELQVNANHNQPPRTAQIEVRYGAASLLPPRNSTGLAKQFGITQLPLNVVEVREINPPRGVQPVSWVLWTSLPLNTFEQAWQIIEYYERRPTIEEFHKALKTGCGLERRQYKTAKSLEALSALVSVVALRLVQLKTVARAEPDRPAEEVVPKSWIKMLTHVRKSQRKPLTTVRDFYRGLAGLGGFLGRKHDGEPGWITLWRGFEKLQLLMRGVATMKQNCG